MGANLVYKPCRYNVPLKLFPLVCYTKKFRTTGEKVLNYSQ